MPEIHVNLFQGIGASLEKATEVFVSSTAANIISQITPWAIAGVGLWVALYGYLVIAGRITDPVIDFLFKVTKIIVIAGFALNANHYFNWVVGFLNALEAGLTMAINQSSEAKTIYEGLDHNLLKGMELLKACMEKVDSSGWAELKQAFKWFFVGIVHAISFSVVSLVGGVVIVMAGVLLKVMFAVGPLFVMCLMWPLTTRFFDSWFSQVMTYIFKIVLAAASMSLCLRVFEYYSKKIDVTHLSDQNVILVAIECLIASYMLSRLVKEAIGVADQLGSGVSSAVAGARELLSGAKTPLKVLKRMVNPEKTKRDFKTGFAYTASRTEHVLAGNTILNPNYIRWGLQNIRSGWSRRNKK